MRYDDVGFTKFDVRDFNLRHTFESAQPLTFHADFDEGSNTVTYESGHNIINVRHEGSAEDGRLYVACSNMPYAKNDVVTRFRLHDDMRKIYRGINTDSFIGTAIRKYRGMRLTVNDPWETTLVFILSQFNNVKRIRLITKRLSERFGPEIKDDYGRPMRGFPSSSALASATEDEIWDCGTGFRARYVRSAAQYCNNNLDLNSLKGKGYDRIKSELLQIDGVGEKVADCIALMGYGKLEAFPVDTWVKRVMERVYFKDREKRIREIREFAEERWGKLCGYAQQYAFWHGRESDEFLP